MTALDAKREERRWPRAPKREARRWLGAWHRPGPRHDDNDTVRGLVGSLALAVLTETAVAANHRDAAHALYAAEAAVEFVLQEIAVAEDWTEVLAAPGQSSFVDGEPAGVRQAGATNIDLSEATVDVSAAATAPAGAVGSSAGAVRFRAVQ